MSAGKRTLTQILIGVGAGVATAAACVFLLGITWPLGVGIGAVFGIGCGMFMAPYAPSKLEIESGATPITVEDSLTAVNQRVTAMDGAMRRLSSRPLWTGTRVDEQINALLGRLRSMTQLPEIRQRTQIDGDVHMLYVLATDYLPTIVNHAIENDRMHTAFSGTGSRKQVEQNVHALEDQLVILSEVMDRIETDVVRGKTQSIQEHAAFLKLRFEQAGTNSVLDLKQPLE
ncbi:MAG: hypothetical protein ACTHXA_00305 [Gulosibacter sp.]|uniref:hypothetical protein n=1 Tax=Gulosibacter sp. TaxID=2817531 RepID=UPI003F922676